MNFWRTFVRSLLPAKLRFVLVTEPLSPSSGHGPGLGNLDCVLAMPPSPVPLPSRLMQSPSSNQLALGGLSVGFFPSPPCEGEERLPLQWKAPNIMENNLSNLW